MKKFFKKATTALITSTPVLALTGLVSAQGIPLPKGIQFIPTSGSLESSIVAFINWGLAFAGLVAVAVLIYGGYTYIISRGEEKETTRAKNIILYSIIGLVIILLAFVIVQAVVNIL